MEEKKPKIKILVACHKADPNIRQDDIYMPIQVGKALHPELDLGFQCDNTGDNISEKNGSYCELTALYWAWKNLKDVDYIGLCHYRRYFNYDVNIENISKVLSKNDVIAVNLRDTPFSTAHDLQSLLCQEDVAIAQDTLISLYPQIKKTAINYLYHSNKVSQANMFIMKWENFCEYCNFIFTLLGELEKRMMPHSYSRLQRNLGYIAENFQQMYFDFRKYKVKYVDKIDPEQPQESEIKTMARKLRNKIIFNLINKSDSMVVYNSVKIGLEKDNIYLNL